MKNQNGSNGALPVIAFEGQILETVKGAAVTIITAETGAGKSTQVPQFLANAGYRVVVTQPRRLAARALAKRVAQEMGTRLGDRVGFRTAEERSDSAATEVLFVTDGLQLVRELAGQGGTGRKTVLVLDEVHEWNMNVEVLIAWVKSRISAGDDLRCVLMSATLDADRLASYYSGAPVISVPGRLFPVEKKSASARDLVAEAVSLAKQGRNVLVFQPGKREIADTVEQIKRELGERAIVLPLHGELSPEEQQCCFDPAPAGKVKVIVSTNVAQTSVTIPDIDAVVDSGIERRVELADGIEGLYLKPISKADCEQRAGRAGRTKAGVYVLCSETGMTDRQPYPTAEIMRSRLDQMILRLAVQGFDATSLEFFHQPDRKEIHEAKRALKALGCMDPTGKVTRKGQRVSTMPISVETACMVIEAEKLGVVDDVLTVAAILEIGEVTASKDELGRPATAWRELCRDEQESDVLAQLAVYKAAGEMKKDDLRKRGVHAKAYFQAKDVRRHLAESLKGKVRDFRSSGKREDILRSVCAGMVDHLYKYDYGGYRNGDGMSRQINRDSVIRSADWLVGVPWDLQVKMRRGGMTTLHLIRMATKVKPEWLADVAPQLVEKKAGLNPRYDAQKDMCVSTTQVYFNGQMVKEETVDDPEHAEAADIFCAWLASQMV